MKFLFLFFSIFFIFRPSFAALAPRLHSIIFEVAASPKQTMDLQAGSIYSNKIDLNILYFVRGGPTFGFRYLIENRSESGTSESGESYGPSAGYYWERGWFFLGHYDILSKLGNWRNGEGFQLDLGYLEHVGSQYHIGFQYSTKNIVYKTDKTNSLAESRRVKDSYPSLVLMYLF